MRRRLLLLAAAAWLVSGCSSGGSPARAAYVPVPDSVLYSRIAHLPGVTHADLGWTNKFGHPNAYGGVIDVRRGVDPVHVLDEVLAILWTGRPGASLQGVIINPQGEDEVFTTTVGLGSPSALAARYGPQPGNGVPPPTPLKRSGS